MRNYRSATTPLVNAGMTIAYSCSAEQGALLRLNRRGTSEVLLDKDDLRDYILENHEHWHNYARNTLKLRIEREDLVFIRGFVKTAPDWLAASFSSSGSTIKVNLNAAIANIVGATLVGSTSQTHRSSPIVRFGTSLSQPSPSQPDKQSTIDQCIAIQRYVVKKRRWTPSKLEASADPNRFPDSDENDSETGLSMDGAAGDETDENSSSVRHYLMLNYCALYRLIVVCFA